MKKNKFKKTAVLKYVIAIIVFVLVVVGIILAKKKIMNFSFKNDVNKLFQKEEEKIDEAKLVKEKPLKIYNGTNRNIAVMISNEKTAWPQAGLTNAYMIYECIIEGGETRFMALFKDKLPDKIGPVRSSRHYFLDYLEEHQAIYAHFGWSDLAMQRIKERGVQNINGIYDKYFWREGGGYNNAFVSNKTITNFATQKGYPLTSNVKFPFAISSKNVEIENGSECSYAKLIYSGMHYVEYNYNADNKLYYRSMRGQKHIDRVTKEQLAVKNIVVMQINNFNLNDYKGSVRQDLDNIGTGSGYYITNGKAEKITWSKPSYKSKTVIKDLNGKEITLNDGLTFMQIVPTKYNVEIR